MLIDNKHKKEMEEALKKQAMELEDEFKRRLLDVELNGMEGQTDCKKVVATLIKHFDKCFDVSEILIPVNDLLG